VADGQFIIYYTKCYCEKSGDEKRDTTKDTTQEPTVTGFTAWLQGWRRNRIRL